MKTTSLHVPERGKNLKGNAEDRALLSSPGLWGARVMLKIGLSLAHHCYGGARVMLKIGLSLAHHCYGGLG